MEPEVLDTHILHKNGSFMQVRRWLRGIYPERGTITWGLSGWETVEERSVILPSGRFTVIDKEI